MTDTKYLSYCCPSVSCAAEHEQGFVDRADAVAHIRDAHGSEHKPITRRWPHSVHEYEGSGPIQ
jgi:hypothetical protein